jgi:SseB protein N-terminal domain
MNSFENTPTPTPNGAHALAKSNSAVAMSQSDRVLPVETAIAAGMAAGDTDAVMRAVASVEVMVPQTVESRGEDLPAGSLSLPVIEQDGTSYVPVFTSEATMKQAAPDIDDAVSVPVATLGANWPSDELWLAVNPGTEDGLTLPPDAVRSLPSYADGAALNI